MILEFIILALSVAIIFLIAFVRNLFNRNIELQQEISTMKESVSDKVKHLENQIKMQDDLTSIEPGDKAIIPDYGLSSTKTKVEFKVTYEVEIVEVSTKKVKVNAIDFTSQDSFAQDPKNKKPIIDFLQNIWIDRKEIQLIVDDQIRRERKLDQILN